MDFEVSHSTLLLAVSFAVSFISAFTALRLLEVTHDMSTLNFRIRIAMAAFVLGSGIWAMHFISMLAIVFDPPAYYDPLRTLASFVVAVIATQCAFMLLLFRKPTTATVHIAGGFQGAGIIFMHYLGMSALSENYIQTYSIRSVAFASFIAIALSILAFRVAFGKAPAFLKRQKMTAAPKDEKWDRFSIVSSITLAVAFTLKHHIAMASTTFGLNEDFAFQPPFIDNYQIALIVTVVSFCLCCLFLLLTVPDNLLPISIRNRVASQRNSITIKPDDTAPASPPAENTRIPYETKFGVMWALPEKIQIVRADAHYSQISMDEQDFLCPWPISRLEKVLTQQGFLRTHRSYLVNVNFVKGFGYDDRKAFCFVGDSARAKVPVSRTYIPKIKELLSSSDDGQLHQY